MRISQTNTVLEFKLLENLVLLLGGPLNNYQKDRKAKVQILNVPQNIPPDAPRIIVSSQNSFVNISLTRFEIVCRIPDHITDNPEATIDFTKKIVTDIIEYLWVDELDYNWAGLVSTVEYPSEQFKRTAIELAVPFFDKLINIDRKNRELATFEIKVGFNEKPFFKNYYITCYETRDIKIDPHMFPSLHNILNLEEFSKIKVAGFRVVVDINNKPKEVRKDHLADLEELSKEFRTSIANIHNDLNFSELV